MPAVINTTDAYRVEVKRNDKMLPPLLYDLFCLATPYGTEHHIINLLPFKNEGTIDKFGNFIIEIGENIETMFSCHMDTVHTLHRDIPKGEAGNISLLTIKGSNDPTKHGWIHAGVKKVNKITKTISFEGIQLGGDDKIGVFTMCEMIKAKIPGLYVFHVGEEVGCVGSKYIVQHSPALVQNIKRCIAFDRKGYTDVIAFQRGQRCASAAFTNELAKRLNEAGAEAPGSKFEGEVQGLYTDSANYAELISECTNLSIGYFDAHSCSEKFDWYWYTKWFLPSVLKMDWNIPVTRDPKAKTYVAYQNPHYHTNGMGYQSQYGSTTLVKYSEVTKHTPYNRLPLWIPSDGYILDCSTEGMLRLIEGWGASHFEKRNELVANLMLEVQDLKETLIDLKVENSNLKKALGEKALAHLTPEKFKLNLAEKTRLIESFITTTDMSQLDVDEAKNYIISCRIFRKITKKLKRKHSICTHDNYTTLNQLLCTLLDVAPDSVPLSVIKEACNFIQINKEEAGFEALGAQIEKGREKEDNVIHLPAQEDFANFAQDQNFLN